MKRTIYLKMIVDWEDYDDVSNELIIEDSGILDSLKEGVNIEQIAAPFLIPIKDASPEDYAQIKFNDDLDEV
ncbi:MAG: hypothetical protein WC428_02660 [Candidatus Paceibacterota bacterium]